MQRIILCVCLAFAVTPCVLAQEGAPPPVVRVAIGLAVTPAVESPQTETLLIEGVPVSSALRFTFDFAAGIRVEPEIGLQRTHRDGGFDKRTSTGLRLGIGVMPVWAGARHALYGGARVRYSRERSVSERDDPEFPNRDEWTSSAVRALPVFGGEYRFSRRFAVGGEIAFGYVEYVSTTIVSRFRAVPAQFTPVIRFYLN